MKVLRNPPATSAVDSILAFDLASRSGWAYVGHSGEVLFGSIEFPKGIGLFMAAEKWFKLMLDRFQPALIASEEPTGGRSPHVLRILYGLWTILRMEAKRREIAVYPVINSAWKKDLMGKGNIPPAEYLEFVRNLGYRCLNADQAAALGILWHVDALIP